MRLSYEDRGVSGDENVERVLAVFPRVRVFHPGGGISCVVVARRHLWRGDHIIVGLLDVRYLKTYSHPLTRRQARRKDPQLLHMLAPIGNGQQEGVETLGAYVKLIIGGLLQF